MPVSYTIHIYSYLDNLRTTRAVIWRAARGLRGHTVALLPHHSRFQRRPQLAPPSPRRAVQAAVHATPGAAVAQTIR